MIEHVQGRGEYRQRSGEPLPRQFDIAGQLPVFVDDYHFNQIEVTVSFAVRSSTGIILPDMQIDSQLQYDNISGQFSFFSRFRWFTRPETEFFIALGHTANIDSDAFPRSFRSEQTEAIIRLGHTFRF